MTTPLKIAIVNPGDIFAKELISIIEERDFPVSSLEILSPPGTEGRIIQTKNENKLVTPIFENSLLDIDLAFFILKKEETESLISINRNSRTFIIDVNGSLNSNTDIPLAIPEINTEMIKENRSRIVSVPKSISIQLSTILYPIHQQYGIKRVIVSTYQSISNKGEEAIDQLARQTISLLNFDSTDQEDIQPRMAFNCHIDSENIDQDGYSEQENTIANQTRKLLDQKDLNITINTVTVPVFHCDSLSLNIETVKKIPKTQLKKLFCNEDCIISEYGDYAANFPTPNMAANKDEIFVGRIREDKSTTNGINMWCVMDNLRKGSALTALRIAEKLIDLDII